MKQKLTATVISQQEIAPGIYDMWIEMCIRDSEEYWPGISRYGGRFKFRLFFLSV